MAGIWIWIEPLRDTPRMLASIVVLVAAAQDILKNRVPNLLTFPAAACGLALGAFHGGLAGFGNSLAGLGAGVGFLFIPFALRATHGGDVKLLGAVGAFLGPWQVFWAFLLASVFGGLLALPMLIVTPRGRKKLAIWWVKLKNWALTRDASVLKHGEKEDRIYMPYAVPIALGTLTSILTEGILY